MSFTKKFLWRVVFCAVSVLLCFAAVSFAAQEKYILENSDTVYRVKADGKRQKVEDIDVRAAGRAKGTVFWFIVDPNVNDAMEGSESGIYFFDDNDKPLFFMPYEDVGMVSNVIFSPDAKQMVLDVGTWVIRDYILYDFKKNKEKASFTGISDPIWLDPHRFAFTMVEPDAEPRPSATDFDGWTSVVVYDTAVNEIVPVMTATETKNYTLTDVDWDTDELKITETSVKTKMDWADHEKYQEKEITVPFPAVG